MEVGFLVQTDPAPKIECRRFDVYGQLLWVMTLVMTVLWLRSFIESVVAVDSPRAPVNLEQRIEQEVEALGYDLETAQACRQMALSWKTWRHSCVLDHWFQKMQTTRCQTEQGDCSVESLAKVQFKVAQDLRDHLHRHIRPTDDIYDLTEVVRRQRAQCLGFTQLYYVLGRALGLEVEVINVLNLLKDQPLTAGHGHVSCMVRLVDERVVMFDVVDLWAHSDPFVFKEAYTRVGVTWELQHPVADSDQLFACIQCLDRDGLRAQWLNAQGATAAQQGRWGQALAWFEQAVEMDPNAVQIRNNRAGAYLKCGRLDQALVDCDDAIALNPKLEGPYNTRGMCHSHGGRWEAALQDFDAALERCPDFAKAYNNRGCLYNKTAQYQRAIEDFDCALDLAPSYAEAYLNRANTYTRLGDYQRAIASYNAAARCESTPQQVYLSRGLVYALAGQDKQACRDLQQALDVSPAFRPKVERIVNRFGLDLPLAQVSSQRNPHATGPGNP